MSGLQTKTTSRFSRKTSDWTDIGRRNCMVVHRVQMTRDVFLIWKRGIENTWARLKTETRLWLSIRARLTNSRPRISPPLPCHHSSSQRIQQETLIFNLRRRGQGGHHMIGTSRLSFVERRYIKIHRKRRGKRPWRAPAPWMNSVNHSVKTLVTVGSFNSPVLIIVMDPFLLNPMSMNSAKVFENLAERPILG